jgi:hypothetical protein
VPTHYDTLGVPSTASSEEIRRAYRRLAQRFHPDRHLQSSAVEAANASRRMRDINRAWSVLSDAAARQHYDLELALARAKAARAEPAARSAPSAARPAPAPARRPEPSYHAGYVDVAPGYGVWTAVLRAVPWLLVIVVLGGIFVFTAFAAAGKRHDAIPEQPIVATTVAVGDCVRRLSSTVLGIVDCSRTNEGRIVEKVSVGRPCPRDSSAIYLPDETVYACIRPY